MRELTRNLIDIDSYMMMKGQQDVVDADMEGEFQPQGLR